MLLSLLLLLSLYLYLEIAGLNLSLQEIKSSMLLKYIYMISYPRNPYAAKVHHFPGPRTRTRTVLYVQYLCVSTGHVYECQTIPTCVRDGTCGTISHRKTGPYVVGMASACKDKFSSHEYCMKYSIPIAANPSVSISRRRHKPATRTVRYPGLPRADVFRVVARYRDLLPIRGGRHTQVLLFYPRSREKRIHREGRDANAGQHALQCGSC